MARVAGVDRLYVVRPREARLGHVEGNLAESAALPGDRLIDTL